MPVHLPLSNPGLCMSFGLSRQTQAFYMACDRLFTASLQSRQQAGAALKNRSVCVSFDDGHPVAGMVRTGDTGLIRSAAPRGIRTAGTQPGLPEMSVAEGSANKREKIPLTNILLIILFLLFPVD